MNKDVYIKTKEDGALIVTYNPREGLYNLEFSLEHSSFKIKEEDLKQIIHLVK